MKGEEREQGRSVQLRRRRPQSDERHERERDRHQLTLERHAKVRTRRASGEFRPSPLSLRKHRRTEQAKAHDASGDGDGGGAAASRPRAPHDVHATSMRSGTGTHRRVVMHQRQQHLNPAPEPRVFFLPMLYYKHSVLRYRRLLRLSVRGSSDKAGLCAAAAGKRCLLR